MLDFGFYNMDCMEGMKQFPDKYFDLAVVDPPYGINVTGTPGGGNKQWIPFGGVQHKSAVQNRLATIGGGLAVPPKSYKAFDDSHIPDAAYFSELERVAKHRIIFGGNYFLDHLGATECLIVWDKKRRGLNFADCEIAWTDIKQPCRIFEFKWNGMLQEDMTNKEYRIHPTQKPMKLYEWILATFAKDGDVILDTHVGSASSLIACQRTGHEYVGFEIDQDYYEMAQKRLNTDGAQTTLWQMGYNPYQE